MKMTSEKPLNQQCDREPLETPTQRKMHGEKREGEFQHEHYHGERPLDIDDEPGDIELETLDRDAPFNKSYGLRDEK